MESTQAEIDTKVATKAREYCEALRDFLYTRKEEDKKLWLSLQQELLTLCPKQ